MFRKSDVCMLACAAFLVGVADPSVIKAKPAGMALVPAGEYEMGDHHGDGEPDELPVHAVYVNTFYIGVHEVTSREYAEGLNWAIAQAPPLIKVDGDHVKGNDNNLFYCDTIASEDTSLITYSGGTFGVVTGKENHPMGCVSWYGAAAYANWRTAMSGRTPKYDTSTWECNFAATGYRLPTEAEWEKAARGGLYDPYRRYPTGDTIDGTCVNYQDSGDPYEPLVPAPAPWSTPVCFYNGDLHHKTDFDWPGDQETFQTSNCVNGYGLCDMAGNVSELCNDWYSPTYYDASPYDNPRGPVSGGSRVHRGAPYDYYASYLRCANRFDAASGIENHANLGFRLVWDGSPTGMALVPAGEFQMGDPWDEGEADERPVHTVYVSAYHIDRYEVTNQQYADGLNWAKQRELVYVGKDSIVYGTGNDEAYCDTTLSSNYSRITWNGSTFGVTSGKEDHPMVQVSWYGSVAYANWRSAMEGKPLCYDHIDETPPNWDCNFCVDGYRLPTEAEWEKAAGWDPVQGRHFRFGEHTDGCGYDCLNGHRANYVNSGDPFDNDTTPVGYYDGTNYDGYQTENAQSHYGCFDMSGNVWQWCNDWYRSSYYGELEATEPNPAGPSSDSYHVLRGGGWSREVSLCRVAARYFNLPDYRDPNFGVRVALPSDADGDGVPDACDNCLCLENPGQDDQNDDGIGDACETTLEIVGSWPPDGAIDARQPSNLSGSQLFGWDSVELTISGDASGMTAEDFAVTEAGGDSVAASIAKVAVVSPGTIQITLADRIEPGARTTFTHKASCTQTCIGYLPADTDSDGVSAMPDILSLIDHLNGAFQPAMQTWQCDVDRSGRCAPADILRVIDLLNGADYFDAWLGQRLPDCPGRP